LIATLGLQAFNGFQHLLYLIGFGHPLVILDIDPWISLPRRLIDAMAAASLSGLAKEEITDLAEVAETDRFRVSSHLSKDLFDLSHMKMVPLLVSLSSWNPAQR
jgi:hypothetical protein